MKIGILAIDNGLGHIRRQSILANHLSLNGYSVSIYCNYENSKKFTFESDVNLYDLSIDLNDLDLNKKINKKLSSIPFKNYDLFISDNLIEVLEFYPNSIIFGSFFWHKSMNISKHYYDKCEYLLKRHHPMIIANKYFAPNYIKTNNNVKLIGLFSDIRNKKDDFNKKNDILISSGLGKTEQFPVLDLLKFCENLSIRVKNTIWVEPKYFNQLKSNRFKLATYNNEMYQKIKVALVRPGLGTVSDLLASNCIIIPIHEDNNEEMKHNAKVLYSLGHFNYKASNISQILETIFYNEDFVFTPDRLKFSGENDTLSIIKDIM